MNEEEKLWRALSVSRPEAFWRGQKQRIMARIQARRVRPVVWSLAPALAAATVVLALHWRRGAPTPPAAVPPAQEWALLERLDLLEDMDVIESLGKKGLL